MRVSVMKRVRATGHTALSTLVVMACMAGFCIAAGQPVNSPVAGTQQHASNAPVVAAGRKLLRICKRWHSLDPGRTLVGPSLAGLIGRQSGTLSGFEYSAAMKRSHIAWGPRTLDAYLADPEKVVPGNRMQFAGLKSDLDRRVVQEAP